MYRERISNNIRFVREKSPRDYPSSPMSNIRIKKKSPSQEKSPKLGPLPESYTEIAARKKHIRQVSLSPNSKYFTAHSQPHYSNAYSNSSYANLDADRHNNSFNFKATSSAQKTFGARDVYNNRGRTYNEEPRYQGGFCLDMNLQSFGENNSKDPPGSHLKGKNKVLQGYHHTDQRLKERDNRIIPEDFQRQYEEDYDNYIDRSLEDNFINNSAYGNRKIAESRISGLSEKLSRDKEDFYNQLHSQNKKFPIKDTNSNPYLMRDLDNHGESFIDDMLYNKLSSVNNNSQSITNQFDEILRKQKERLNKLDTKKGPEPRLSVQNPNPYVPELNSPGFNTMKGQNDLAISRPGNLSPHGSRSPQESKEQRLKVEGLVRELEAENRRAKEELKRVNDEMIKFKLRGGADSRNDLYDEDGEVNRMLKSLHRQYSQELNQKNEEVEYLKNALNEHSGIKGGNRTDLAQDLKNTIDKYTKEKLMMEAEIINSSERYIALSEEFEIYRARVQQEVQIQCTRLMEENKRLQNQLQSSALQLEEYKRNNITSSGSRSNLNKADDAKQEQNIDKIREEYESALHKKDEVISKMKQESSETIEFIKNELSQKEELLKRLEREHEREVNEVKEKARILEKQFTSSGSGDERLREVQQDLLKLTERFEGYRKEKEAEVKELNDNREQEISEARRKYEDKDKAANQEIHDLKQLKQSLEGQIHEIRREAEKEKVANKEKIKLLEGTNEKLKLDFEEYKRDQEVEYVKIEYNKAREIKKLTQTIEALKKGPEETNRFMDSELKEARKTIIEKENEYKKLSELVRSKDKESQEIISNKDKVNNNLLQKISSMEEQMNIGSSDVAKEREGDRNKYNSLLEEHNKLKKDQQDKLIQEEEEKNKIREQLLRVQYSQKEDKKVEESLRKQIKELNEQVVMLLNDKNGTKEDSSKLGDQLKKNLATIEALENEKRKILSEKDEIEKQNRSKMEEFETKLKQSRKTIEELEQNNKQLQEKTKGIEDLQKENGEIKAELKDNSSKTSSKLQEAEAVKSTLEDQIKQLKNLLDEHEKKTAHLTQVNSEQDQKLKRLETKESDGSSSKQEVEALSKEKTLAQEELKKMKEQYEREKDEMTSKLVKSEEEVKQMKKLNEETEKELEKGRDVEAEMVSKLLQLQHEIMEANANTNASQASSQTIERIKREKEKLEEDLHEQEAMVVYYKGEVERNLDQLDEYSKKEQKYLQQIRELKNPKKGGK